MNYLMIFLYNLFIGVYAALICAAAPFNRKARLFAQGRRGQWQRIGQQLAERRGGKSIVHFHCASVGEFEQGRPIIEELKRRHPDVQILLTFFSPSGFEACRNYADADYVFYLPLDFWWNARRFVRMVKPVAAVFVKYEYWHYHLKYLQQSGAKCYLASAIFRTEQPFFAPIIGKFFRNILHRFDTIFVQNEDSLHLLQKYGFRAITVSGDTRFDRVANIAQKPKPLPILENWADGHNVLVAGSTWGEDETLLTQVANADADLRIIFVPHELHEARIQKLMQGLDSPAVRYSYITQNKDINPADYRYIVIDCVGILSSVYKLARYAYIGGGFGAGIHNILEAAVYGIPVFFGTNYSKFREAHELIALGAAFSVKNSQSLQDALQKFNRDNAEYERCGAICKHYVGQNTGATQKICDKLN
jgi:3-deoxy-D-manno-octulosonic-acid transferase